MGIECRFVDPADPENFRRATDAKTRCYYGETLPNPKLAVFPIAEVAEDRPRARRAADHGQHRGAGAVPADRARRRDRRCIRPRNISAATAPRSAASSSMAAISTGRSMPTRFPMLNTPDPSYHGAVWTQAVKPLGPIAYIIKARVTLLRDIGAAMSPFNAFLFIQGLETLPLRMRAALRQRQRGGAASRQAPEGHQGDLSRACMTGEAKRRADAYLKGGYGGLVGFELEGRPRRRPQLHRRAEDVLPRRQYRRCAQPRDPSGDRRRIRS